MGMFPKYQNCDDTAVNDYDRQVKALSKAGQVIEIDVAHKLAEAFEAYKAALEDVKSKAITNDLVYAATDALGELEDGAAKSFLGDATEAGITHEHKTLLGDIVYY